MNATAALPKNPQELRPLLHAEVDRLPDEHLEKAHRMLSEMEIEWLVEGLGAATEDAWKLGEITPEKIESAILEHRQKHPYR